MRAIQGNKDFNLSIAKGAIRRAQSAAPAIVGARVLWVDDKPENNEIERRALTELEINVQYVTTSKDALLELRRHPYDLIISNVRRPSDPSVQLKHCRVHYFEYPDEDIRRTYEAPGGRGLNGFNEDANLKGQAGFSMIESIADDESAVVPPVIFYAARSAEIVRSLCGHTITNRPSKQDEAE